LAAGEKGDENANGKPAAKPAKPRATARKSSPRKAAAKPPSSRG
jgi:hypothetical protein